MLRGGPPTVELMRPVGPEIPSDERVYLVLDFCLKVGEVLLSSGEAAVDTRATMGRQYLDIKTSEVALTCAARNPGIHWRPFRRRANREE